MPRAKVTPPRASSLCSVTTFKIKMSLPNIWHHRRVADSSAKACWICYKPTPSVLITPDNKDFFYICVGHLKDRQFCRADEDEAAAAAAAAAAKKDKEELDREIEKVKQEYEEKQKRKKEKRKEKAKEKGKDKEKDKDAKKADDEEDTKDEKAKDDKVKELSEAKDAPKADDGPRIYSLTKNFYQMRIDRLRNAEIAKRNRERLKNPTAFPSVPSTSP